MKRKKLLTGVMILCLLAAGVAGWTLSRGGWAWPVPETLAEQVRFERLADRLDELQQDGYVEADDDRRIYFRLAWKGTSVPGAIDDSGDGRMLVFYEESADSPEILLRCAEDGAPEDEVRASACTRYDRDGDGAPFLQTLTLTSNRGSLRIVRRTSGLFSGRDQLLGDLEDFCQRYLSE